MARLWGAQTGLWSDVFTYDEMSNVKTSTDARGVKTTYSYQNPAIPELIIDPLNRLFSVTYETNGAANVLPSPSVKFEYQPTGNVSQVTGIYTETAVGGNPQRVVTNNFLYDLFGRITEKKTTLASRPDFPMATNYVYDSLNRVTDEYYPAQYGMGNSPRKNINHTFDQVGRRSSLKVDNVNYASSFVYNNLDQVTSVKIGPAGANQITEQYDYNLQSGNLQNQKVLRGSATLLDLSYQYQQCSCSTGGSGQITGITDNLNRNKDRLYEYDKLSRLKKVTGGLNQTWSQGYTYDRFGNRLSVTALGFEALRVQDQATSNKKERDKIIDDVVPKSSLLTKDVLLEKVADLSILNRETENESKPSPLDPNKQSEQTSTSVNLTTPGTPFDFDGDSKADYSTWNRSVSSVPVGTWTIKTVRQDRTAQPNLVQVAIRSHRLITMATGKPI
ncbi:MAG: hypothetical protein IPQ00_07125 [Chloracidobacterium sp.]|nr:hypothetical protein [Chloracidobacterium sp.]